jgi:hypothetical protein
MKTILIAVASALSIIAAAPVLAGEAGVKVHLDPNPAANGACPATVVFHGQIETAKPMDVTFHWQRSDGATHEKTKHFEKAGKHQVSEPWTLERNYKGWEQIEITSPVQVKSEKALFEVRCGKSGK